MKRTLLALLLALFPATLSAETGYASWYIPDNPDALTASGDAYDPTAMAAASKDIPLGSVVRVTDLSTGSSVEVTVNDRTEENEPRLIVLTPSAARALGIGESGTARVSVDILQSGKAESEDSGFISLSVLTTSDAAAAYDAYGKIEDAGLKPWVASSGGNLTVSVRWVPRWREEQVKEMLSGLGLSVSAESPDTDPLL